MLRYAAPNSALERRTAPQRPLDGIAKYLEKLHRLLGVHRSEAETVQIELRPLVPAEASSSIHRPRQTKPLPLPSRSPARPATIAGSTDRSTAGPRSPRRHGGGIRACPSTAGSIQPVPVGVMTTSTERSKAPTRFNSSRASLRPLFRRIGRPKPDIDPDGFERILVRERAYLGSGGSRRDEFPPCPSKFFPADEGSRAAGLERRFRLRADPVR